MEWMEVVDFGSVLQISSPTSPLTPDTPTWLLFIGQQGILLLQHLLFCAHNILPGDSSHPPVTPP